ncbi:unnamed protein product, partial [Closterium sp. NIES-54]
DHFLALDPTTLIVDDFEKHLLAAEKNILAVGAACGTPRSPLFEGCSPSPLTPSYASAAAAHDYLGAEEVGAASAPSGKRRSGRGGKGGTGGGGGGGGGSGAGGGGGGGGGVDVGVEAVEVVVGAAEALGAVEGAAAAVGEEGAVVAVVVRASSSRSSSSSNSSSVSARPPLPNSFLTGLCAGRQCTRFHTEQRCFARLSDAWRAKFPDAPEFPNWPDLLRRDVPIFDLDYEAILAAMYALSVSAEGECYLCVPPNLGIAPAALGACESAPLGTAPTQALHTFTLDSGASRCFFRNSTTVNPLPAPVPVSLADPSKGPVLARSSTVLPCPAVPSGELSGLHLPSFSTNLAPLQTLHLDVYGPARVRGQVHERYFLQVFDDYTRYTTVFPLHRKGDVPAVLIPWIRAARLQLRESIRQTFTLPASLQQNGVAERRIGLVMEVARTSMIHAAAPHFLWPFAVRYAAHQLNLWPRVSLPETSPTLLWTGKVGDTSRFRFYDPASRRVFASQDVTFDESCSFRCVSGRPPHTCEVTGDSGPAGSGAVPGGAELGGTESGGAERVEPGGAEPAHEELGGAVSGCCVWRCCVWRCCVWGC